MNKTEKIGDLVRRTRKQQELTQAQLAAVSGVGIRFVRELENGKASCHIGKALTVLAMLGMEIKINDEQL